MEQKLKDIKVDIVNYIKTNKVTMKPRWHFILFALLRVIAVVVVFVSILYLASFITLVMREHELFRALGLRPQSVHGFMLSVPWFLVVLSLILLVLLEVLTRKFQFVYRRPIVYSIFALLVLVLVVGAIVREVDKEFRFARFGEKPNAPILGPVHRYYRGEFGERPFVRGMHKNPDMKSMKYFPQ